MVGFYGKLVGKYTMLWEYVGTPSTFLIYLEYLFVDFEARPVKGVQLSRPFLVSPLLPGKDGTADALFLLIPILTNMLYMG